MGTRLVQITMKAHDDAALGGFWARALGWTMSSEGPGVTTLGPAGIPYPDPAAVFIDLIASPEPGTGKNRVHLDLATNSPEHKAELVARLRADGATLIDIGQGDVSWTVMADPEGNEFCVLDWHDPESDTGPISTVVVDCADPRVMAGFWGRATDWTVLRAGDDNAVLRSWQGVGPYLQFLRTPDVKTGWNRVHLDIRPYPGDDPAAEAARLESLGAVMIPLDGDVSWSVMADHEGNEFCLLAPG
ncbi:VOC family protein [Actinoplanes bogorensis]|uniref:VOC family protein n=1 Tax=Paractinoplanes bogorensis TaxID=1610840 RepID=A0ABS5YNS6_9ACTN|nr:VOC family protein [Actinoplanes bogorensis]MBU2665114.1 VOC family protein [Actinoplanes bogorensis]